MTVYTINPEPWEHIFWTLAVMGGTGAVVSIVFWLAVRPLQREILRLHRRLARLEKRLSKSLGVEAYVDKEDDIPIHLLD